MRTVIETPTFQRQVSALWTDDERLAFITWLAANPEAGVVIPGADGARKIRWTAPGKGKRGGTQIIYFNLAKDETLVLVTIYAKNERDNVSSDNINKAR